MDTQGVTDRPKIMLPIAAKPLLPAIMLGQLM
jgi:NDP-sugar pyrophosphorylase family protein